MPPPVIQVEGLSKRYRIGARESYHTFRDALVEGFTAPFKRIRDLARRGLSSVVGGPSSVVRGPDDFWALKDVSFEVQQGEVLGIIGRNGAGKSTLLKILSRITEPTEGRAIVRGRVASLLEVGTGFHPELTGRENIFLNGAILGMSRAEIRRKFAEIVAFAETEKFIDTPVKRYSSGMQVRLAFAVAAHLEPEILLVDEVLAVGDVAFQQKCLGRMQSISREGTRTVLFVSHNMAAIEGICGRAILLEDGKLAFLGDRRHAIQRYMESFRGHNSDGWVQLGSPDAAGGGGTARILEARVTSPCTKSQSVFPAGSPLQFEVTCSAAARLKDPRLGIGIDTEVGQRVVTLMNGFDRTTPTPEAGPGEFTFVCRPMDLVLAPGQYRAKLALASGRCQEHVLSDALSFTISPSDFYRCGGNLGKGIVLCEQRWELRSGNGRAGQGP